MLLLKPTLNVIACNFTIDNIVSSSSDSASMQSKLVRLLEEETGNDIIDNKCAMHLGVNLRVAQVKAAANFNSTDVITDDHDGEEMQETALLSGRSTSESDYEESSLIDSTPLSYDIDSFLHELAKLMGTPEYCHGSLTFRVFLEQKTRESRGDEKEYYLSVQKVVLECQVGSCYFVTSWMFVFPSYDFDCIFKRAKVNEEF